MNLSYVLPFHVYKAIADEAFCATYVDADLDTGETQAYVQLTTPDDDARRHLIVLVHANQDVTVQLYENPTTSAGSAMTEINMNRAGTGTTTVVCKSEPTIGADGTLLFEAVTNEAGTAVIDGFLIKANEDYLVKVLPTADNTRVSVTMIWYKG